jgi:hypothetical protein
MAQEAIKKYKFVSPGIFVNEIDNSQLPNISNRIGPVIIGRTARGPGMRPVKVESFSDFVEIFGNPEAGGQGGDVWRDGNHQAPLYASYAAQAWLRNNTPATIVRLLGYSHGDATTAGAAGWETKDNAGNANGIDIVDSGGGAYGLFLINSSSTGVLSSSTVWNVAKDSTPATGTLAAIWYLNEGSLVLTGTLADGTQTASGSAVLIQSLGSDKEFRAVVRDRDSNVVKTTTFNFNKNSQRYIRKVFNTNPTLTNPDIALGANTASYFLGSTFERDVDNYVTNNGTGQVFGVILGLKGNSGTKEGSDFRMSAQAAQTGWFFSQDLQIVSGTANNFQPENMTKLFKFHCLDTGDWTQQNIKISIQDIKASTNPFDPFGVFTVVVRKASDSDNAPQIVERFSSCNLNPASANYVAKKIGDKYLSWDETERRYIEYGNYLNQSKFFRIEMNADVDAGAINAECLPFGCYGPVRHKGFAIISGSSAANTFGSSITTAFAAAHVQGGTSIVRSQGIASQFVKPGTLMFTGSFVFPEMMLRSSSISGDLASPKDAYFGLDNSINTTSTRVDPGYKDLVKPLASGYDSFAANTTETEYSWIFTLDNLSSSGTNHVAYVSGSRALGSSSTAQSSNNYRGILDSGFDRFTIPLFGGFEGLDITEKEPFNNTDMEGESETSNYAYNSIKRAIDCVADPEVVEMNIAVAPGITNESLTSHLLTVCENRADALAVIDLTGEFVPNTENNNGDAANIGSVDTTISNLKARGLNSSYGCAYYPWVQIVDSITNATLWCPPSVVALGVMGSSETKSELWFAPAGFNRGGLTEGSAGIPVVGVREKLTSKQRDKLYEANINSIASFPSEGIVIFGQKTLQVTPSALDRINVRRLMIFLEKEISRMAKTILFDQNVRSTWNKFLSLAEPFLLSVKIGLGLTDYKLILDETTTTTEMIDRNIMYAKVLLKPARAIEYITIDFNISNSGASFSE